MLRKRQMLFNFLSSSYAYNEHLRAILVHFYPGEKIGEKHKKETDDLYKCGPYVFVMNFRNHNTHNIIPAVYTNTDSSENVPDWISKNNLDELERKRGVELKKKNKPAEFKKFEKRSKIVQNYIKSYGEQIPIFPIFEEFMEKIKLLKDWLIKELISEYSDEITEFLFLVDKQNRITKNFKDNVNKWKAGEHNLEPHLYSELITGNAPTNTISSPFDFSTVKVIFKKIKGITYTQLEYGMDY
ncbi:MAG: hypothetical protein FWG19_00160 [Methanomassiliicoccaceae archaeon]|nr:hypothetical protein [Methanomassiliicoccaceae archaeon]